MGIFVIKESCADMCPARVAIKLDRGGNELNLAKEESDWMGHTLHKKQRLNLVNLQY